MTRSSPTRWSISTVARRWWLDALLLVAACGSLIAACVVWSPQKLMWEDEILTQMMLTDHSIGHMLRAIAAGADSAPPLYHLLARVWIALWGSSPQSLRLFSSIGICAALVILWITLRRTFGRVATALGVLPIFVMPATLLKQNVEVRYYGVLLSLAAFAILMTLRVMSRVDGVGRRLWVANALATAALVLTHLYGGLYSAVLCAACVAYDVGRGRWRPLTYASYIAGWAAFIPWVGPFLRQSAMAQGKSWIPMPTLSDLVSSYQFGIRWLPFVVIVAVLVVPMMRRPRSMAMTSGTPPVRARAPYLVVAGALLVVPILSFAVSHVLTPVFYDRYLMPASFAWAIIVAWIADRPDASGHAVTDRVAGTIRLAGTALIVATIAFLVVLPVRYARVTPKMPNWPAEFEALTIDGKPVTDYPIGVEDVETFLQFRYYSAHGRYTYIVDSAVADGAGAAPRAIVELNLLKIFGRYGYVEPSSAIPLQRTADFLCRRQFVVLDDPSLGWFEARVARDSNWHSRALGFYGRDTARFVWNAREPDVDCTGGPGQPYRSSRDKSVEGLSSSTSHAEANRGVEERSDAR